MKKKFGAVIAAGGSGTRFGTDVPKQFVEALGIPVIAHTISKFQSCKYIDSIVIVTHKDYIVFCSDIVKEFHFDKVTSIIEGGSTRQMSVFKGIKAINTDYVLIHDAARPLIEENVITDCCMTLKNYGSCAVGTKVTDTVKMSSDGQYIDKTIDRNLLWQIQTPQCFERDFILRCHKNAAFEAYEATDDCALAEYYGEKIRLIEGSSKNIKLTSYSDLAVAEVLLDD